ncbi:hypothetical protein pb186bvf_011956 [Paramecium bursaria]
MIKIVLLLVIAIVVSTYDGKDPIFGIEDYSIVKPLDFLSEIPIIQQIEEQAEQELNYLEHPEEVQQQEFKSAQKQLFNDDQLQLDNDKDVKYWLNQLDKDGIDLSDETPIMLLQKKKKEQIIEIEQIQIDLTNPDKKTNKIRSETITQSDYEIPDGNIIDHIEIDPQQFILITDYQIEFDEPKEEVVGFKVQKKNNLAKDTHNQNHSHNKNMIDLSFDDDDELQIQQEDSIQDQQEVNQYDAYDMHYDESETEQETQKHQSQQINENKQNYKNNQDNINNSNKQNNQNNQEYIDDQKTKSIVQKLKERVWNKIDDRQEQNIKPTESEKSKLNEKLPQSYQQVDTDQKINNDIKTLQSIVSIPQEPNHQIQERLYFKPEDDIPQKQFIYEDVKFPEAKLQDHQINLEEQQLKEKLEFINNKVLHVDQPKIEKQNQWDDVLERQDKMYDIKGFQELPQKPIAKQDSKTNEQELFDKVRQIIQPKQEPIVPTIQKAENTIIQQVIKKEGEEEETHKVSKEEYARMRQERIKQVHEELKQQFSSKKGTKQEIMKETKETPYVYESNYQDWKMSSKSQMSFVLIQQNIRGKKK